MFKWTLTYKLVILVQSIFQYFSVKNIIGESIYSDGFRVLIKKYIHGNLQKDWLGRLYCVINPSIDINGNFDASSMIIEIDGENTNNIEHVKNWVYKQMRLVGGLFKIQQLYDYINIDFRHVGPQNQDNYLLIFDIVARQKMAKMFKKVCKQIFIYVLIVALVYLIYKLSF